MYMDVQIFCAGYGLRKALCMDYVEQTWSSSWMLCRSEILVSLPASHSLKNYVTATRARCARGYIASGKFFPEVLLHAHLLLLLPQWYHSIVDLQHLTQNLTHPTICTVACPYTSKVPSKSFCAIIFLRQLQYKTSKKTDTKRDDTVESGVKVADLQSWKDFAPTNRAALL